MSDKAAAFLAEWLNRNFDAEGRPIAREFDGDERALARLCIADADEAGISRDVLKAQVARLRVQIDVDSQTKNREV